MPGHFTRRGYTNLQVMVSELVTDLKASGFTLLNAYQATATGDPIFGANSAPSHSATTSFYVLAPGKTVDPLALDTGQDADPNYSRRQPWRLVIHAFDAPGADEEDPNKNLDFIRIWVCTPNQIITNASGEIRVAEYEDGKQSGFLAPNNIAVSSTSSGGGTTSKRAAFFARKNENIDGLRWSCFQSELADQQAVPLTYSLSVTDHGIMFTMWAENYDGAGDCFNWFVVQRFVKDDGSILLDQKSPLVCVFSQNGGGAADANTVVPEGIMYFFVSEEDINAPTIPVSAVSLTPDSFPFINPIQQVGVMTNRNYIMHFPKGINTQRHYYPYALDLMAYASADVISHNSTQAITLYGQPRQYIALNANSLNNKGMRPLMIKQGSGIN